MFVIRRMLYIKDLNALRILMNFLWIYLGEKKCGGGGALMHVSTKMYMGTHSQLLLQNRLMDVYETW